MDRVTSADGTSIGRYRTGDGPPVLLVGGALNDHTVWDPLLPLLRERASVHTMDRRGRGASGDRPGSTPADERADVAAVLDRIAQAEGPVVLAGHSSGALLALHAAAGAAPEVLRAVVAYEPPPPPVDPGVVDRLRSLAGAEAVTEFLTGAVGMPEGTARARVAAEPGLLPLAHTAAYDAAIATDGLPDGVARRVGAPVTLLLGTVSPPRIAEHVRAVAGRLPRAAVRSLEGQAHFAVGEAPGLVARALLDVLDTA